MRRIEVDFNTLTSKPVNLVKLAEVGSDAERELLPLREKERVTLWEPGLEVEATQVLYGGDYWMARPMARPGTICRCRQKKRPGSSRFPKGFTHNGRSAHILRSAYFRLCAGWRSGWRSMTFSQQKRLRVMLLRAA